MKNLYAIALTSAMAATPLLVHSHEHARFAVTLGYVSQHANSDTPADISLSDVPASCQQPRCAELETSADDSGASIGLSWYVTPAIAIELWAPQSRTSDTEVDMELAPDIGLTSYRAEPLMVSAQYHLRVNARFTSFAGIGWQKTRVSRVNGNPAVAKTTGLQIDDASGFAAVAGLDIGLGERWFVRGDVRYLDGDSRVRATNQPARTMDVSTVTYGLSAGLRF